MLKALVLVSIVFLSSCGLAHKSVPNYSLQKTAQNVNLQENAVVAFRILESPAPQIKLVLKSVETEQWYTISINSGMYKSDAVPDSILTDMLVEMRDVYVNPFLGMYAFPPGKYVPVGNYYKASRDDRATLMGDGDTLNFEAGKVNSLGTIQIDSKFGFFEKIIDLRTSSQDIDTLIWKSKIQALKEIKINHLNLVSICHK